MAKKLIDARHISGDLNQVIQTSPHNLQRSFDILTYFSDLRPYITFAPRDSHLDPEAVAPK